MTVTQFEARFSALRLEAERGGEYLRFLDGYGCFLASIELKYARTGPRIEVFVLDISGRNTHEYLPADASAQTVATTLATILDRIWSRVGQCCEACQSVWSGTAVVDTCPNCGDDDTYSWSLDFGAI